MPRRPASDMNPAQFRFYRDYLGLTQQDVADALGLSHVRTVAAWDSERNPSIEAAQFIHERMAQARSQLTTAVRALNRASTEHDGATVELRRYTTEDALHREHPEFERVRHYDAHLAHVAAALIAGGATIRIIT